MTLSELVAEEKKLNARKIPVALIAGFVVGLAVWSATHEGGFLLTVLLLSVPFLLGSRYAKSLKGVQEEISRRDTIR